MSETEKFPLCDLCNNQMIILQPWDFMVAICLKHEKPRLGQFTWIGVPMCSKSYKDVDDLNKLPKSWTDEILKTLRIKLSSECTKCRQKKDPTRPEPMILIFCNNEWDIWRCPKCFDVWKAPCNFEENYS